MIVDLKSVLMPAKHEKKAIPLFNVVTMEQAEGVFQAAEALAYPIIIGTSEAFLKAVDFTCITGMLMAKAAALKTPVVVHFDHGRTFEGCMRALRAGFSSVMYDCSSLPYEENVSKLAQMVRIAHSMQVTVEGELGCVAGREGGMGESEPKLKLTDPLMAKDFATRTGIDSLAISVGNAHGAYKLPPKLDFALIEAIAAHVSVPLVLHGGSGISPADIRHAIECGISKINVFTEIDQAQAQASSEAVRKGLFGTLSARTDQVAVVRQVAEAKIRLFGGIV